MGRLSRITRRIRRWIYYFKRELNIRKIKFTMSALLDPFIGFLFRSRIFRGMATKYLFQQYSIKAAARKVRLVEKKFGVRYLATNLFPPDIFWNDYGERLDFLPKENGVAVDIGANIGDWSIIAAGHYGSRVVAIEPSPDPYRILLGNIRLNKLQKRVVALNCALSSKNEEILAQVDEASGYFSMENNQRGNALKVAARTLDALVKEYGLQRVDLVKIDTEGFEAKILEGSTRTISEHKPRIIVEVHSEGLRQEVLRRMLRNGYLLMHEKVNFYEPHQTLVSVVYLAPD